MKDFKKMKPIVIKSKLHHRLKKERISFLYLSNEKELDIFYRFSALFLPFAFFVHVRLEDSVSGTGHIYKRNTIKNRKFSAGIPWNET